jgi:hypothetical protein
MAAYNIRTFIYIPHLKSFLYAQTGHNFDMDNFYTYPLSRQIAFTGVSVDGIVRADKIVIKTNFGKILKNITKPANFISGIEFYNISVDLDSANIAGAQEKQEESPPKTSFSMPLSKVKINADVLTVKSKKEILKVENIEMEVSPEKLTLSSVFLPLDIPVYVSGVMKRGEKDNILDTEFTIVSEGKIKSIISAEGAVNTEDFSVEQNITIEKMKSDYFEITDVYGTLIKNDAGIKASFSGESGNLFFERGASGDIEAKSKIYLSKLNKDISAETESSFVYKNGEGSLKLSLRDLSVYGFDLGSFDISASRIESGDYDIFCDYGKSGKIYGSYKKDGIYDIKMSFDKKTVGALSGNFKTGEIDVKMNKAAISELPVIRGISGNAGGTVTVNGALSEISGLIDFSVENLKTSKMEETDIFGTITRSADIYVFYFYKSDKSMIFNSVIKSGEILSTDFKFVNTDISNVLKSFGYANDKISGSASGRIRYEKDGTTDFDVKAYDGSFFGNKYSKFETKGDINLSRININKFHLKGVDGRISAYANGLIGFTNMNPVSSLNVRMRKINFGAATVDTDITFGGELNSKNEVSGTIASNSIKVSGAAFNNFRADAVIALDKLILSNIKSDNGLDGNFSLVSAKGAHKLSGEINLKNTNINGVYRGLEASVNAAAKMSGTAQKPVADITVSVRKGKYSEIPFSFSSELSYINDALKIKKAELSSVKMKLLVEEKSDKERKNEFSVEFEDLNEAIINKFVGFRTPVTGEFSGKGTLYQHEKTRSRLQMDISSRKAFVKGVKFDNIKSKIEVYGSKISISSASAKLADSEIRADKGSFNIKSGIYDLSLFLVNAHLGPVDIFGRINIDGKMDKRKGGSVYNGKFDIKNLWINKYRLTSLGFDYTIKDKEFTVLKSSGQLNISGAVDFSEYIKIKDINISKSSAAVDLNAFFKDEDFNFNASGKNIDLEFLSEILDIPVDISGKSDFGIAASGYFSAPEAKFSFRSNKGSIMEIPYDSIDIDIESSNNKAEIKTARIFRRNEINVNMKGSFPFWVDDSLTEEMKNMPINVMYEADDSKLYLLKYLSGGEIKPKSGRIQIKGEIKGTSNKIQNSGELSVSNGVFDSKTYLDRMKDFNADIVWDDNLVKINKLSGKSGSGRVSATGGLTLEGFNVQNFDILIQTDNKGIPIKVPQLPMSDTLLSRGILQEFSSGEPRFKITLSGTPDKPKIAGWVSLENTRFCFPPPDTPSDTEDILPDSAEFDIELRAAKNTKFENSFADAWINGSLFIRGTYASPKPQGIIETQRGTIKYLGIVFDVINAKIEIIDENTMFISGEAETNVYSQIKADSETIILTIVRSTIDNLNVHFSSKDDPTLDSQTALARVTKTEQVVNTGASRELILGIISDFDLRQQALRLIDSSFATPIARNVLRRTGLADNFRVSYVNSDQQTLIVDDPTFADLLYGTKYSVEKNITNQFLLGYSVTFDQIQRKLDLKHEVEMRYKLNNNLYLSGSYELESENSLHEPDRRLMLQHQIRFGLPSNKRSKATRGGK